MQCDHNLGMGIEGFAEKRRQLYFSLFLLMKENLFIQLVQKGGSAECWFPYISNDGDVFLEC